ncbi:MAG: HNH endonuclease [Thermoplasmataceae archaeon]
MIKQISLSGKIYDSIYKAKETLDNEYQDASEWITDIIENPERLRQKGCEICSSNKKLEEHHVRGKKHGNETIAVCLECHTTLTDKQRLWDRSWLDPDSENKDAFLEIGLIDICELKYKKTGIEIYKLISENLTRGFSYE